VTLLDSAEVVVRRRTAADTAYGPVYSDDGPPMAVACSVRALTAAETRQLGWQATAGIRILARSWPGDERSAVRWDGADWEPDGPALRRDGSPATAHFQIDCRLAR